MAEAKFGPVKILVNNAGTAKPGDFLSYELEDFDAVINLNLRGSIHCYAESRADYDSEAN